MSCEELRNLCRRMKFVNEVFSSWSNFETLWKSPKVIFNSILLKRSLWKSDHGKNKINNSRRSIIMAWRKILGVNYGLNHGRLVFRFFFSCHVWFCHWIGFSQSAKTHYLPESSKRPLLEDLRFLTILTDLQNNPKQMWMSSPITIKKHGYRKGRHLSYFFLHLLHIENCVFWFVVSAIHLFILALSGHQHHCLTLCFSKHCMFPAEMHLRVVDTISTMYTFPLFVIVCVFVCQLIRLNSAHLLQNVILVGLGFGPKRRRKEKQP